MMDVENNETSDLSRGEAQLKQLENEEQVIEARDHHGFGDVVLRNRLVDEINELETELIHEKERVHQDQAKGGS